MARNRPAFEPLEVKLDRTRRQGHAPDARGSFRGAAPLHLGGGRGGGDVTIVNRSGGGVEIHKAILRASAQTIADGGAIEWNEILGAPTLQYGLRNLTLPATQIPIDVLGVAQGSLSFLWASYRGGGDVKIVRIRDGSEDPFTFRPGTLTTRGFDGDYHAVDVKPGDVLEVRPNASGSSQDLTDAELQLEIRVVHQITSDVPVQLPESLYASALLVDHAEYDHTEYSDTEYASALLVDHAEYDHTEYSDTEYAAALLRDEVI